MDALLILGGFFLLLGMYFWLALRAFAHGAGWRLLSLLLPLTLLKDKKRGWSVAGDRYPPRSEPGRPADGAKPLKS